MLEFFTSTAVSIGIFQEKNEFHRGTEMTDGGNGTRRDENRESLGDPRAERGV
jgi:hypothetical protein